MDRTVLYLLYAIIVHLIRACSTAWAFRFPPFHFYMKDYLIAAFFKSFNLHVFHIQYYCCIILVEHKPLL